MKACYPQSKWFKTAQVGINTILSTVSHISAKSGIEGYKTKRSLRVMAATCLFHQGVDEQLIMACTGHCSQDRVWINKRPCEELSGMLHGGDEEEASEKKMRLSETDKENYFKEVMKQNPLDHAPNIHFTGYSGITH